MIQLVVRNEKDGAEPHPTYGCTTSKLNCLSMHMRQHSFQATSSNEDSRRYSRETRDMLHGSFLGKLGGTCGGRGGRGSARSWIQLVTPAARFFSDRTAVHHCCCGPTRGAQLVVMECGTRDQKELLFASGVQQDFHLGGLFVNSCVVFMLLLAEKTQVVGMCIDAALLYRYSAVVD